MRLAASELRKILTTWAILIYVFILVAIVALIVVGVFLTTDDVEFGQQTLNDLFSGGAITTIFALLLGVLVYTAEFRHGTAAETFLVTPRRERVTAAKTVVGLVLGALLGLLALALIAAMAVPWMEARDLSEDLWDDELVKLYLATLGMSALWGAMGVGAGGAVRNQVAAVVGVLVWFLVLENILFGLVPSVGKWAPGIATNAVLDPSIEDDLSENAGWLVTLGWTAAIVAAGTVLVRERDVH